MTVTADELAGLCAGVAGIYEDCFGDWCRLIDGCRHPDWDAVVASQAPMHEAAERLRAWCLATPEATAVAEARRQALMVAQVEGEQL